MALSGLVVPVPTLFGDDGALDLGRNSRFARTLSEEKVEHLFALGSLGEFPSIVDEERGRFIDTVVESAKGPTDVWVGVGAPSTRQAVRYADEAESLGAAAVVAVPPYYLHPSEASIERYYRAIRAELSVPLLAYNIPALVGYPLSPALVHRLAQDGVLAGVKDTSGSAESVRGFLAARPARCAVLPGNDRLAAEVIQLGATGAIMGLANIVPRLCVELVRRAQAGDAAGAVELQHLVGKVADAVDAGPFPSTVKFLAARFRGAEVGYRAPYDPLSDDEAGRVLGLWAELEPELARYRAA